MNKDFILKLYQLPQTVFSLAELSQLSPEIAYNDLKRRLGYYVSVGKLLHLRRGVYAKKGYNVLEIPQKLYSPSYISLQTVLAQSNIIFQASSAVNSVSYLTRDLKTANTVFTYQKIKEPVLTNYEGINKVSNLYAIASKERAFLDAVYLFGNYHFDNLTPLNWNKVFELQTIYKNRSLENRVGEYYTIHKNSYA